MPEPSGQDAILYVQLLNATQGETQTEARRWVDADPANTMPFDRLLCAPATISGTLMARSPQALFARAR